MVRERAAIDDARLVADFDDELGAALPAVRAWLRRLVGARPDVDDLVQDTWLRASRYRASFDPSRPMDGWLKQIAFRLFLDWRQRAARAPLELGPGADRLPATPDAAAEREWIERQLARLRPVEREALLRFHRDGESVADIGVALRLPEGTVRSHLHRARRKLAEDQS